MWCVFASSETPLINIPSYWLYEEGRGKCGQKMLLWRRVKERNDVGGHSVGWSGLSWLRSLDPLQNQKEVKWSVNPEIKKVSGIMWKSLRSGGDGDVEDTATDEWE